MNHALHDAMPVYNVQRCLEELEQQALALEQAPRGPAEHSLSDSVVSDGVLSVWPAQEWRAGFIYSAHQGLTEDLSWNRCS